jgi:nucleoside-diphosphate-sugar epimerase
LKTILVTGGAGYVGAVLVPKLLAAGYQVKVIDLYIYGADVLAEVKGHPCLKEVKGDIRDMSLLKREIPGTDAIIHLACISNDPSYELNPRLGKSINYDAFPPLVSVSKESGVKRFIFASSSSVYGVKDDPQVTEDLTLEPLTDYSRYKALCEEYLLQQQGRDFTVLIFRPATVCGYSPRLRLDLTVNILTNHAINKRVITVFGGEQRRPNIHIEDITDLYVKALEYPARKISGKIFNVGYQNYRVKELADLVKETLQMPDIRIICQPTDDNRSYHISSRKIYRELGFEPSHGIEEAVRDLRRAFDAGKIPESFDNPRYYNIKTMQAIALE